MISATGKIILVHMNRKFIRIGEASSDSEDYTCSDRHCNVKLTVKHLQHTDIYVLTGGNHICQEISNYKIEAMRATHDMNHKIYYTSEDPEAIWRNRTRHMSIESRVYLPRKNRFLISAVKRIRTSQWILDSVFNVDDEPQIGRHWYVGDDLSIPVYWEMICNDLQ